MTPMVSATKKMTLYKSLCPRRCSSAVGNGMVEDCFIKTSCYLDRTVAKGVPGFLRCCAGGWSSVTPKSYLPMTVLSGLGRMVANHVMYADEKTGASSSHTVTRVGAISVVSDCMNPSSSQLVGPFVTRVAGMSFNPSPIDGLLSG